MNEVRLYGRLGRDPMFSKTQSGKSVTFFTVAVDNGKDKDGNQREPDWIPCKAWEQTADFIDKWIGKGCRVLLHGELKPSKQEKDGKTVYNLEFIVRKVFPIDWKNDEGHTASVQASYETNQPAPILDITSDDLPF